LKEEKRSWIFLFQAQRRFVWVNSVPFFDGGHDNQWSDPSPGTHQHDSWERATAVIMWLIVHCLNDEIKILQFPIRQDMVGWIIFIHFETGRVNGKTF
jgi:hypothetical protein